MLNLLTLKYMECHRSQHSSLRRAPPPPPRMLFNIYMKVLGKVVRRAGLYYPQYAGGNDIRLYLRLPFDPREAVGRPHLEEAWVCM